jgi:fibronectin type 3 domain-containing protein
MKLGWIALLMVTSLPAFQGVPHCTSVDPDTAKTGDMINVTCENADKTSFADLYLTDGKDDTKVSIKGKTTDKITFQVPRIKPGRYHIAFLTVNKASMVEQPVALTVE